MKQSKLTQVSEGLVARITIIQALTRTHPTIRPLCSTFHRAGCILAVVAGSAANFALS
ncbi:MAG TPA: hypothetical protein V6D13_09985 [Halomicronema sp.]